MQVVIVNQDCFYRDLDEEQRAIAAKGEYNFDHPGKTSSLVQQDYSSVTRNSQATLAIIDPYSLQLCFQTKSDCSIILSLAIVLCTCDNGSE